jgi:ABC-2 type transport system ATP-binding protein
MITSNPIVQLQNVSKRFRKTQALDSVSVDIVPGRIIGLLGANGCGKSTLLRHMIGLYLPNAGQCITFGVEAKSLTPADLGRIGYVHQEGELLEWMKVKQLIRYVSAYHPGWNAEVEKEYLDGFELPLNQRVGSLSPGQRQKLAILLAIGFEPELLILDEPASGLDPIARSKFLDMLLGIIQNDNRTIIISSHILSDVEKVIDHVIIMDKGQILTDEPFDSLRERFARITLTSLSGPLPSALPFERVVDCERSDSAVALTVRDYAPGDVTEIAAQMNCSAEIRPLPLEGIYRIVLEQDAELASRDLGRDRS